MGVTSLDFRHHPALGQYENRWKRGGLTDITYFAGLPDLLRFRLGLGTNRDVK